MASDLSSDQLRRLARLGAAARLEELRSEEAAIRRAFPEIGQMGGRGRSSATKPAQRRGRTMSPAERKAVSIRMKKYWAGRRKAKAAAR